MALLSDEVAARLRRLDMKCGTVQITVRDPAFHDISRQKGLEIPTYLAREITGTALELLRQSWNPRSPVRALTVTAQNLLPAGEAVEQLEACCRPNPRRGGRKWSGWSAPWMGSVGNTERTPFSPPG